MEKVKMLLKERGSKLKSPITPPVTSTSEKASNEALVTALENTTCPRTTHHASRKEVKTRVCVHAH